MARSKNTRALFEVIKQSQELQRKKNQPSTRKPLFAWFSGKRNSSIPPRVRARAGAAVKDAGPVLREVADAPDIEEHNDVFDVSPPVERDGAADHDEHNAAAGIDVFEGDPDENHSAPPTAHDTHIAAAIAPTREEESADESPSDSVSGDTDQSDEPVVDPDPDGAALPTATAHAAPRNVHLALSYPSIGVAAAGLLLMLVVAFLAGRHTAPPFARTGPSLAQLQAAKPSPGVLDLGNGAAKNTPPSVPDSAAAKPVQPAAKDGAAQKRKTQPAPENVVVPAPAPVESNSAALVPDRRRVIGRNYVIAQSYPDPDNAEKASAMLQKNNIPVSVEQLDAAPGWYCVVTEVGFDRISAPECDRYQKLIRDLNGQAKAARLKAFEPYLYKWK